MKYQYRLESFFLERWVELFSESRDFCLGYMNARRYDAPRNAYRLMRSDGKVVHEMTAETEVSIGQIAGYPTPEQYESAAKRACEQANRIRELQARKDAIAD